MAALFGQGRGQSAPVPLITPEPTPVDVFLDPVVQLAAVCPICALAALRPEAALAALSPALAVFNPALNPRAALLALIYGRQQAAIAQLAQRGGRLALRTAAAVVRPQR
jgi:hypothetical protein